MTVLRTVLIAALFFAGAGTLALEGWLQRIQEQDLIRLRCELDDTMEARRQAEDEFDSVVYEVLYGPSSTDYAAEPIDETMENEEPTKGVESDVVDDVVVSVTFAAFLEQHRDVFEDGPAHADAWREQPVAMGVETQP